MGPSAVLIPVRREETAKCRAASRTFVAVEKGQMGTVARVTEISATSSESFEDAITTGVARTAETLRGVKAAWVKEQEVRVADGRIAEYQANLLVTFVLDE